MEKNFTQTNVFVSTNSVKLASINEIANNYAKYLQEYDAKYNGSEFKKVQSPLEGRFLISLLKKNFYDPIIGRTFKLRGYELNISPQYEVDCGKNKYYPDFCLSIDNTNYDKTFSKIFVEIDGHNFHEKTKEQVTHDKIRERRLIEHCDGVVRFSGSEVYDDPDECADEALDILNKKFVNELTK